MRVYIFLFALFIFLSHNAFARPLTANLTFDANPTSDAITSYKAEIRINGQTGVVYNGTTANSMNIAIDANDGQTVSARIAACNRIGCSTWTAFVDSIVPTVGGGGTTTTAPAIPTGLVITITEGQ